MKTWLRNLLLGLLFLGGDSLAQSNSPAGPLSRRLYRNGEETLRAFGPVTRALRQSVVKLNVDGETVALGVVMDTKGSIITKASEIKKGRITAWLSSDKEVYARMIGVDETLDLALLRVDGRGLKPITWTREPVAVGQWAITPGVLETPHAVGVVSAAARRIRAERPYIGVMFDNSDGGTRIDEVLPGLGAEQAGLQAGDQLIRINGHSVRSRSEVIDLLAEQREGQTAKVEFARNGRTNSTEIKLMVPIESRSANADQARRLAGATSTRVSGFEQVIEHDTVIQPWLCGGPLVNLKGEAIGLNIARAGRVSTYALPPELVQEAFRRLLPK